MQVSTNDIVKADSYEGDSIIGNKSEENRLKSEWTQMFLEGNGFEYILNVFMTKPLSTTEGLFDLKHMAFLLKLLRIFIMAAFSTSGESSIYDATRLIRRTSSTVDAEEPSPIISKLDTTLSDSEFSRFKQLQTLMEGPLGIQIIEQIDYKLVVQRILAIISQIINKPNMILEDKLIIENALSLLVSCILHKVELLEIFYKFSSETFAELSDLLLTGLLLCP